jgi:NAD(P)-dependent dehydrogenase (short-subunit alcohol dehydrogenase family)
MRLTGLVVIVTGSGKGIGRGIAKTFACEGARVIVATLSRESGEEVTKEIHEQGGEAVFIQTDIASERSIRSMVDETVKNFGKIDTLINNAGITLFKPLLEASLEDWDKVMNVDLRGVFLCSKYVIPEMMKLQRGSIINISSAHAAATLPDTEIYAAAKAGVNGMTRSMALSFGKHGIRVNALCPGFTDTPHYRKWLSEKDNPALVESEVIGLHAANRIVMPEDIAKLAVYLASDDSVMMTGAVLLLDGGISARLYNSELC